MKPYLGGLILSIIMLLFLTFIDTIIYNNVMLNNLVITLIVMHVVVYKHLIPEKSYIRYSFYILAIVAAAILSLPEFTHQQAKEQISTVHNIELREVGNMPLDRGGSWNPFVPKVGYLFEGTSSDIEEETLFLFIPDTGKFFEIESEGFLYP